MELSFLGMLDIDPEMVLGYLIFRFNLKDNSKLIMEKLLIKNLLASKTSL